MTIRDPTRVPTRVPMRVPTRILFVCLGNICRSPLAEGVFRSLADARGVGGDFEIDSAGTSGHHSGDPPDTRMCEVAEANGIRLDSRARVVETADFERFDHILCMDERNHASLLARGAPAHKLRLLLSVDPSLAMREVPDPYYGGDDGFHAVYRLVHGACAALLEELPA